MERTVRLALAACRMTVQQIADLFKVPRTTVYGHLDRLRTRRNA